MDGIVIINKPKHQTSHDIVRKAKKILNEKVGHTGTLDPNATGVLPLLIGKGTELSKYLINHDKTYEAILQLGEKRDTGDVEGKIIEQKNVTEKSLNTENINSVFKTLIGKQEQIPPIYSALKVNGKRMCDLVRSGRADEINLKTRPVYIKELNILSIRDNKIMFYVKCSKGTYVRSICYDVGKVLGCGGHMSFLLRTSSGKFNLENGITLEELKEYNDNNTLDKYLYDIDYVLTNFNKIKIHENAEKYYINGGIIDERRFIEKDFNENDEFVRVYSSKEFIGIGKIIRKNNTISVKSDKLFIV